MAEVKMLDSTDGELLLQAVDLKAGGKEENEKSGILLAEVEPILKQWAVRLTDRIESLRDEYRKNHK